MPDVDEIMRQLQELRHLQMEADERFHKHEMNEVVQFQEIKACMNANTETLRRLEESTAGVVSAFGSAQGTIRTLKWLAGLPLVGGAFLYLLDHFTKHGGG